MSSVNFKNNDILVFKEVNLEKGKLFKLPYSVENMKKELINFLNNNLEMIDSDTENDDYRILNFLVEDSYKKEERTKLFKMLNIIDNRDIDVWSKYASVMGLLRVSLYNKDILNMNELDILCVSDVFTETEIDKLPLYDSFLGDINKLTYIMKDKNNYEEKREKLILALDKLELVFRNGVFEEDKKTLS